MKNDKNTFILSKEYKSFTDVMTDEEAGKLFKAILDHENGEQVENIPAEIKSAWAFIKNRLEANAEAYKEKCEQNARNRSNDNSKEENEETTTTDNDRERPITTVNDRKRTSTDNDNDNDKEDDKDNENDSGKDSVTPPKAPRKTQATIVAESDLSPAVKEKLLEWLKYKTERREGYKETGLRNLITTVGKKERENGSTAVIELMSECMSNQWQGIIWERIKKPPNRESTDVTSSWLQNRHKWGET